MVNGKIILLKFFLFFLSPLVTMICFCLKEILPSVKKRWEFEKWQFLDETTQGAKLCFEVSSEGELEQTLPLIHSVLSSGEVIELIFCSPSVKEKVQKLRLSYPKQVRLKSLPLVSYLPWGKQNIEKWMQSKRLILCRYDFFPELLYLGLKNNFILISATLKNKSYSLRREGALGYYFLKIIYGSFDLIVPASKRDETHLKSLNLDSKILSAYDFRFLQIEKRLRASELDKTFFINYLSRFSYEKRLVLGSCWQRDIEILKGDELQNLIKTSKVCVVILPHLVNEKNNNGLVKKLKSIGLDSLIISDLDDKRIKEAEPKVYILSLKGVLCELYQSFGHAYVGGGFERSIHSVLEPFVAGCKVYCGPKVGRSTEFDLIKGINSKRIKVIAENFSPSFFEVENLTDNKDWLEKAINEFQYYKEILND